MGKPCIFLDRDGVINSKAAEGEYVRSWDEFRIIPEVVTWIRLFNALGYVVVVVTNQRGIALGLVTEENLKLIHSNMVQELAARGAFVDDVLYCPHDEGCCECRKPGTGMIREAARKWDIDLERSVVIGDSERDEGMASACALRFVQVRDGRLVRWPRDT